MFLADIGKKKVLLWAKLNGIMPIAIDKGMPIEQVQCILGHVKIDTTLHYAKVNQQNVKISHRKFIS